jgi:predicted dienelactone hydrolase
MNVRLFGILWLLFLGVCFAESYNPLEISDSYKAEWVDLDFFDQKRERLIPVRAYLPLSSQQRPVILFSHGLGGSREGSVYLGRHWAGRGYVCLFMQHSGSDDAVWKQKPFLKRILSMKKAANGQNLRDRIQDVNFLVEQLSIVNTDRNHILYGRLDSEKVGMSGHSFGALTTQAVSGQNYRNQGRLFTIPEIKAAVIFSPSSPRWGGNADDAFGNVQIPWLLMTGTQDLALIGNADMESRLGVFPALPPGGKYELLLYDAEHSAFTDRALPGDKKERNPNHHRAILALSTAFWDLYLCQKQAAEVWLNGNGPFMVLGRKDRWQKK